MLGSMAIMALTLLTGSAQADSGARDTLVLVHEFTAPSEFARVTLESGQVYRVELTNGNSIQVRTLLAGEQNPIVARTEAYPRASRTVVFELAPSVTTVYEFRVGGISRGAAPLRVYWDHHSTARRQKVLSKE